MRWSFLFTLGITLTAVSCSKSHNPYHNPCQEGVTYVETDTARYCVAVVVRGGFECPAELPFQLDIGAGAVCSAERIEVRQLPDVICIEFAECISSDGGKSEDATVVEGDAQVGGPLCSLPPVSMTYEDIASAGSGCPFGDPGSQYNGNAMLLGASSPIVASTTYLRVELDYCPNADDDCRCALNFDVGAERTSNAAQIADALQARVVDPSPVSLHTNVAVPDGAGNWSVTLLDSTALRETLVFAAARSTDFKQTVEGPTVFGGSLRVSWVGADVLCGDPVTRRVAESVEIRFGVGTVVGFVGGVSEIDGDGGDRHAVWITEAFQEVDEGGNTAAVATSAFFVPAQTLSCERPTPTEGQCANQNGLDHYRCAPEEFCFAPDRPNIGICQQYDNCFEDVFMCPEGTVCTSFDDPASCNGGEGYGCVIDCRLDNSICEAPTTCSETSGACEQPSCLEVDGLCDRFHECQPDGSCARIECDTNENCDCGYCVNGFCYAEPGRCELPAP